MGNRNKLLDALPDLLACKKINGKDLPTEVLIRKKGALSSLISCSRLTRVLQGLWRLSVGMVRLFHLHGSFAGTDLFLQSSESVRFLPLFSKRSVLIGYTVWNNHQHLSDVIAEAHIADFVTLTPHLALTEHSPFLPAIDEKHVVPAQVRPLSF
jgi:hypothetical protein